MRRSAMRTCATACATRWQGTRRRRQERSRSSPTSQRGEPGAADSVGRVKIANLYEGRSSELKIGHIGGVWHDVGREAGTRTVGLRRVEIEEGQFSTPAHEHGAEEEIFFVLAGEGLLWQSDQT